MKRIIRLTESDLCNIIRESVDRLISEGVDSGLSDEFKEEMRKYYKDKGWADEQIEGLFDDIVKNFINRGYSEERFADLWKKNCLKDKREKLDNILFDIYKKYACWNANLGNGKVRLEARTEENLRNGIRELGKYGFKPVKVVREKERHHHGSYMVDSWNAYYDDFDASKLEM